MDPSTLKALAEEMGITQARLNSLRQARSFEEACRQLEAFKDEVNRTYKKLAFKYHPDRNPGDPAAEAKFKALAPIRDQALALRLQPPRMQHITVIHHRSAGRVVTQPAVNADVFRRAYTNVNTTTASTTTATYDARRVVFIRVG